MAAAPAAMDLVSFRDDIEGSPFVEVTKRAWRPTLGLHWDKAGSLLGAACGLQDDTWQPADFNQALDSGREIELRVIGRKTGREITDPVWFVREGDRLYLLPVGGSGSNWYKNVLKTPTVRIAVGGAQLEATAAPITDSSSVRQIVDKFGAKYGTDKEYYPQQDVAVEVPLA